MTHLSLKKAISFSWVRFGTFSPAQPRPPPTKAMSSSHMVTDGIWTSISDNLATRTTPLGQQGLHTSLLLLTSLYLGCWTLKHTGCHKNWTHNPFGSRCSHILVSLSSVFRWLYDARRKIRTTNLLQHGRPSSSLNYWLLSGQIHAFRFWKVRLKFEWGWRNNSHCLIILELCCCQVTFEVCLFFKRNNLKILDISRSDGDAFDFRDILSTHWSATHASYTFRMLSLHWKRERY